MLCPRKIIYLATIIGLEATGTVGMNTYRNSRRPHEKYNEFT